MQFTPTEDQVLLRDSVRRFIEREHAARKRPALGHDPAIWALFGEQGWLAAGLPEAVGGLGGGAFDTALIAEELGRGLVPEAYVAVASATAQLLVRIDPAGPLLASLAWGEARPTLAHNEAAARGDRRWIETRARADGDGYILDGAKTAIEGGPAATTWLVSARLHGSDELALFAVAADAPGVHAQHFRTVDNRGASNLVFEQARLGAETRIGAGGDVEAALDFALDHGLVAAGAEAVGAMEAALALTTDYLRTRKQFGQLIGDFQALRHRLADMFIELEQARSIVLRAIEALAADDPKERARVVAASKVRVGQAARFVGAQAIQLHGGIGVTEEYAVGQYFKRLTMFGLHGGTEAAHLERYVSLG